MLAAAVAFAACNPTPEPGGPTGPTGPGDEPTDTTVVTTEIDWSALGEIDVPYLTVTEALAQGATLGATDTTEYVYIRGYVKKLTSNCADAVSNYGNANFYIADSVNAKKDFYAFQLYNVGGQKFTTIEQIAVGDLVVVKVKMINYNGTIESVGKGNGCIYMTTNSYKTPADEVGDITYEAGELSVSDAIAALDTLGDNKTTADSLLVRGQVVQVVDVALTNGNATFYISDGKQRFYIYRAYGLNNQKFTSPDQIKVGDVVTVKGKVQNYKKDKETANLLELTYGYLVRTTNTAEYTENGYKEVTVAEALAIGEALEDKAATDELYRIKGYVTEVKEASTQYGNLTFYMGDNVSSTSTFYVYRAYYKENKKYTSSDPQLEAGDYVEIVGQIMKYGTTVETKQGAAYVDVHTK